VARFWGTLSKSLILSKGQVLILSYLLFNRAAINYNLNNTKHIKNAHQKGERFDLITF